MIFGAMLALTLLALLCGPLAKGSQPTDPLPWLTAIAGMFIIPGVFAARFVGEILGDLFLENTALPMKVTGILVNAAFWAGLTILARWELLHAQQWMRNRRGGGSTFIGREL